MSPTFVHSQNAKLYINGVDLTLYFSKATNASQIDKAPTSTFGTSFQSYVPGLADHTLTAEAYFDGTALAVAAQLETLLAGAPSLFSVLPGGDALGGFAQGFLGFESGYTILTDITAAVKAQMDAQSQVGPVGLVIGDAKNTISTIATSNQTEAQDYGATGPTLLGGEFHYHIFTLTGTGSPAVTLNWQTSPDASTWTTIATSGSKTTAPAYGRVTVAAGVTIDRHSRIQRVTTGSTISTSVWSGFRRYLV